MGTRLSHFSMIQNKAKITANMNQTGKLKHKLQHGTNISLLSFNVNRHFQGLLNVNVGEK
jgi:hypothetical protein